MKPNEVMKQAHQRRKIPMYEPSKRQSVKTPTWEVLGYEQYISLNDLGAILDKYARGKKEIIMEELERRLK